MREEISASERKQIATVVTTLANMPSVGAIFDRPRFVAKEGGQIIAQQNVFGSAPAGAGCDEVDIATLYTELKALYDAKKVTRVLEETPAGTTWDDLYTRLALIREEECKVNRNKLQRELLELTATGRSDVEARAEHLHLYDRIIYTEREPIDEKELFTVNDKDSRSIRDTGINRILIRGQAGIGKSTFCYHYAKWLMQETNTWVFVIPLRLLQHETEDLDDAKVISKVLKPDISYEQLKHALRSTTNTIYWILDGYDEIADLPDTHPLRKWLRAALAKNKLIVTTRPRAIETEFSIDRNIEMTGFAKEDVCGYEKDGVYHLGYIDRYFTSTEDQAAFKHFLSRETQLGAVSRIPVILELLCYAWEHLFRYRHHDSPLSLTELYADIYSSLCIRYLQRNPGDPSIKDRTPVEILKEIDRQKITTAIQKLAYESFKQSKMTFTGAEIVTMIPDDMPASSRNIILQQFGLVRCLQDHGRFDHNEYMFNHLTFQEYLTAVEWVKRFVSDDAALKAEAISLFTGQKREGKWQNSQKYNKRYELVWGFVAGLLKDKPIKLQEFLDLVDAAPRDAIGARHINLLIQIVGEANCLSSDSRECHLINDWLNKDNKKREIGLSDYASTLARYPGLIHGPLRSTIASIYDDGNQLQFAMELYNLEIKIDRGTAYIDKLIRILKGPYSYIVSNAIRAIGQIKLPDDRVDEVVNELLWKLRFGASDVKMSAANAIGQIKLPEDRMNEVVSALLVKLGDGGDVKRSAAHALCQIKLPEDRVREVVNALLRVFEDNDDSVGENVAHALCQIKLPENRINEVVSVLLRNLEDSEVVVKRGAVEVLSQITLPDDRINEVVSALLLKLKDSNELIRRRAANALGRIKLPKDRVHEVEDILLLKLDGSDYPVRGSAANALGQIKLPDARVDEVVSALLRNLGDSDYLVISNAANALGNIKLPDARVDEVVSELLLKLEYRDSNVSGSAANALGKIKLPEDRVHEVADILLLKLEGGSDWRVRSNAAKALDNINKQQIHLIGEPSAAEAIATPDPRLYSTAATVSRPAPVVRVEGARCRCLIQ